jgi:hypothetical protein
LPMVLKVPHLTSDPCYAHTYRYLYVLIKWRRPTRLCGIIIYKCVSLYTGKASFFSYAHWYCLTECKRFLELVAVVNFAVFQIQYLGGILIRIRIQAGSRVFMTKNWKNVQQKKIMLFWYGTFVGHFVLLDQDSYSESGSGSETLKFC